MPLPILIPRLIFWANVHVNMGAIKSSYTIGKEGLVFRVVGNMVRERGVRCRQLNNLRVEKE